jgi:hypothetical protein
VITVVNVDVASVQAKVQGRKFFQAILYAFYNHRTGVTTKPLIRYHYQVSIVSTFNVSHAVKQVSVSDKLHTLVSVQTYEVFDLFFSA